MAVQISQAEVDRILERGATVLAAEHARILAAGKQKLRVRFAYTRLFEAEVLASKLLEVEDLESEELKRLILAQALDSVGKPLLSALEERIEVHSVDVLGDYKPRAAAAAEPPGRVYVLTKEYADEAGPDIIGVFTTREAAEESRLQHTLQAEANDTVVRGRERHDQEEAWDVAYYVDAAEMQVS